MAFKINNPPGGVVVTPNPSAQELASRSFNQISRFRRSLDGRSLVADLNGLPMPIENTRKAVADVYPAGVDASIDYQHDPTGGGGTFGHPEP